MAETKDSGGAQIEALGESLNNGLSQLQDNLSSALTPQIENLGKSLTEAVSGLTEGLKLIENKDSKGETSLDVKREDPEEKANSELETQIVQELENLQEICPEMAEIATQLIGANTSLATLQELEEDQNESLEEPTDASKVLVDSKDTKDIGKGTSLAEICGTGLAVAGNFLKDISDMMFKLCSIACGNSAGMQVVMIDANKSKGEKTEGKSKDKKEKGDSKGKLKAFFSGIAGPLESVAGSLLMLTLCMMLLSTISFDSGLIKSMIVFQAFFLVTFAVLGVISLLYLKIGKKLLKDTKKGEDNKDGSIIGIVKEFAIMMAVTLGLIIVSYFMSDLIQQYWWPILKTLLILFGFLFITLIALSIMGFVMSKLTGKNSPIMKTIMGVVGLVFLIAIFAIFCWLFEDFIWMGMESAIKIFLIVGIMMIGLAVVLLIVSKIKPKVIENFTKLMIVTMVLVVLVALLAIILGLIPQSILIQGMIAVALIIGLVFALMIGLSILCKVVGKVSTKALAQLFAIMIVTGALLLLIGVLVIILGNMPVEVIVLGLVSITIIFALIIGMVLILGKLAEALTSSAPQALIALVILAIFTIAVAAIAWLLTSMLGGFQISQVIAAALAIVTTVICLVLVGAMVFVMAALGPALLPAVPFALLGLALMTGFVLAVAGIALLLTTILPTEVANNAIVAAQAVLITGLALMIMIPLIFLLAVSAIPLVFAVKLALKGLKQINKFLIGFAVQIIFFGVIATILQSMDLSVFSSTLVFIVKVLGLLVAMVPPFALFAMVGLVLAALVAISAVALTMTALGMKIIVWASIILSETLQNMPTNINLKAVTAMIQEFKPLNEAVEAFKAPSLKQMLAVEFSLGFYRDIIRGLKRLGSEGLNAQIKTVAESLALLSGQADPLEKLGNSLEKVAKATRELNSYEQDNGGVARILGFTKSMEISSNFLARLSEPAKEQEKVYAKVLEDILAKLTELTQANKEVAYAAKESADQARLDAIADEGPSGKFIGV